jgi:soluble lytic murein transglycosylase-like protein
VSSPLIRTRPTAAFLAAITLLFPLVAHAAEHITLTNGFEIDCIRREAGPESGKVRLYPVGPSNANPETLTSYIDVAASAIARIEPLPDPPPATLPPATPPVKTSAPSGIHDLLSHAGAQHHIDLDLLLAVVNAESGGQALAVSRAGARGLMQLMPATAATLGVQDAFRPDQNIAGGTTYLDQLLTRYHDDVRLALAAYNAGPGAVDRFHGVPPYRETRAYVARIINEFNRRKRLALQAAAQQP